MRTWCVIVFLAPAVAACALSHERGGASRPDAAVVVADAAMRPDAWSPPDVMAPGSCQDVWLAMPWCPASTEAALGRPCDAEGQACGDGCCEPGPPIVCTGGRWAPTIAEPDCSSIRCGPPRPCGEGQCPYRATCVQLAGETLAPARCVFPEPHLDTCGDAPAGALTSDPRACITCGCTDAPLGLDVTIECTCC